MLGSVALRVLKDLFKVSNLIINEILEIIKKYEHLSKASFLM